MEKAKKGPIIQPKDFRLALKLLRKNWYFLLTLPLISTSIAFYIGYKKPNIYKAQTELLIQNKGNSSPFSSSVGSYFDYYQAYSNMGNQTRILQSFDLHKEVVSRLNMEVAYYTEGRIRTVESWGTPPFIITFDSAYSQAIQEIPIHLTFTEKNIEIEYEYGGDDFVSTVKSDVTSISTSHFKADIDCSRLLKKVVTEKEPIEYTIMYRNLNYTIESYRRKIGIRNIDKSSILNISISDNVNQRAKDYLDTLNVVYNEFSIRERLKVNETTDLFISNQIKDLVGQINDGEYQLESFKEKAEIFNLSEEETRYFQKLIDYDDQVKTLELRISTLNSLEDYIKKAKNENLLPPAFYIPQDDPYIKSTLQELYNMQIEKIQNLYDLKEDNPNIDRSNQSFDRIKEDMMKYLNGSKNAIQSKIKEFKGLINKYERLLRNIPQAQREIINIKRQVTVSEKLYNYLLEQQANVSIERASIAPDSEVVDSPRSLGVISPNRTQIYGIGALIGLLIAVAIGAIRFLFFDKIENVHEFKDFSHVPVVAGIPHFEELLLPTDKGFSNSMIADAFRKLRTNLQFFGLESGQVLLVSSLFPSEGKTFTSSQLSSMLAMAGKKVILLDFDLHKPNVHKTLKIPNKSGTSNIISQENEAIEQHIQRMSFGLDVITTGKTPPNASDLVLKPKVKQLIQDLKEEYDYVVIDTPPLHLITDAYVLMNLSDLNLLVLDTKNATQNAIRDIDEFYDEYKFDGSFGLILNGIKISRWRYGYGKYSYKYAYKYGHGYGSHYGSGYGYGYGDKK